MPENLGKTIQVATVEMANGRYKIKSTGGESYSFFSKTRDGYPTAVFKSFQSNNVQPGSVVDIVYVENAGVNQTTGQPITYKNIQEFRAGTGEPVFKTPTPVISAPAPQSNGAKMIAVDEERLATEIIGKMVYGFIESEIQAGATTIRQANNGMYVAEAIMLAERVYNDCKGPNRERLRNSRRQRPLERPENVVTEPDIPLEDPFDDWGEADDSN